MANVNFTISPDTRAAALTKLADGNLGGGLGLIVDMLKQNGIASDDAIHSVMGVMDEVAKSGRNATVDDLAHILSTRMQNSMAETANTVGSTVKTPGRLRGIASALARHKTPITLGAAGLLGTLGTYGLIRRDQERNSLAGRTRRYFNSLNKRIRKYFA